MKLRDFSGHYRVNAADLIALSGETVIDACLSGCEADFGTAYRCEYMHYYEWMLRNYLCAKHLVGAALFYCQTEWLGKGAASNLGTYTRYYSIHHAVAAVLTLLPSLSFKCVRKLSHTQCLELMQEKLKSCGVMPDLACQLYNHLLASREAFSYRVPLGSLRGGMRRGLWVEDELSKQYEAVVPALMQLANILSYGLHTYGGSKFKGVEDEYDEHQLECDEMFFGAIEVKDRLGSVCDVDDDDYHRFGYLLRHMAMPVPQSWFLAEKFCEDLECGWWEKAHEEDFSINSVGNALVSWLE